MNKFEKKLANRDARNDGKKEVKTWDAPVKKGKKGGQKACPGYLDHQRQRRKPLTVPCETCKRKFCSVECYESHEKFCKAKLYYAKTGDLAPLLDLAKQTYDKYVGADGEVKEFLDSKGERISHWMLGYSFGDYEEAKVILRKHEKEYLRGRNGYW